MNKDLEEAIAKTGNRPSDFYSDYELDALGIKHGNNCLIHRTNIIIAPQKLIVGDHSRIDGFNVISATGGITIGSYVHIASHCVLMGADGIDIGNFVSVAAGSKIFSASDDMMGRGLVNPCVPADRRYVHRGKIVFEDHACLAVNTVVMPGAVLGYGSTLLPFSVLMKGTPEKGVVLQGVPARVLKAKLDGFLEAAQKADKELL